MAAYGAVPGRGRAPGRPPGRARHRAGALVVTLAGTAAVVAFVWLSHERRIAATGLVLVLGVLLLGVVALLGVTGLSSHSPVKQCSLHLPPPQVPLSQASAASRKPRFPVVESGECGWRAETR